MSAPKKMIGTASGQPETAMQKLKAVWLRLPAPTQDYWREQFSSARLQSDVRAEIARKLSVKLPFDSKLTNFRKWLKDQDRRDAQAERMEENTRRVQTEHPDWALDQVREEVLRQSYFETLASGDFKLGLAARKSDLAEQALKLDRNKFEFNAAQACLKRLPELKAVSEAPKLSADEKAKAIQQILFPK